jgi:putative membrane protein insertion efficiency factor
MPDPKPTSNPREEQPGDSEDPSPRFRPVVGLLVFCVRCYQRLLSPLLGSHCKFQPTCSRYFIEAVRKYGAIRGSAKGLWRICRCHPFTPGGYDPP